MSLFLWLEQEDGIAEQIRGNVFLAQLAGLSTRPLLLMLASCRGAGGGYDDMLKALGPQLARTGVPAVLGFQGDVTMGTIKTLLAIMIAELRRDGQIDRALAAARSALGDKRPWWQAVLWLRTDGRLWDERQERPTSRTQRLRALLHDHSGFIASRIEAFVGREAELSEIHRRIAEKLHTGGYVTITGQAGQGKSSVIAKLIADALHVDGTDMAALGDQLQQPQAGVPVCHFIPFSPGPDHQVSLLHNLIARICLSYGLPDFYATSDSRSALRDYFATALRNLAKQGRQEIIYIDGLDQIEEDASGVRDLSFLPEAPPIGIVFVLGTRPNDTLKPLELRKPQHEYWLPPLSRADFDLILLHRNVHIPQQLADQFYRVMQKNALYLDLVAKELREKGSLPPQDLIAHIADNPENLFSLSIERLKRNRLYWREVLKPILGLLLATRATLSRKALRVLVGADDELIREGLNRLGGLIQIDGEGRYGLYHLKLRDYLRQDETKQGKTYVFATDEVEGFEQQLAMWCEQHGGGIDVIWQNVPGDAVEQERRAYARQHFVAHLAAAQAYERLWAVIDRSSYGRAKRRYDPSMRSFSLDLDVARQTVFDLVKQDYPNIAERVALLPRLWKYSLLRCSLSAYPDNWYTVGYEHRDSSEAHTRSYPE